MLCIIAGSLPVQVQYNALVISVHSARLVRRTVGAECLPRSSFPLLSPAEVQSRRVDDRNVFRMSIYAVLSNSVVQPSCPTAHPSSGFLIVSLPTPRNFPIRESRCTMQKAVSGVPTWFDYFLAVWSEHRGGRVIVIL